MNYEEAIECMRKEEVVYFRSAPDKFVPGVITNLSDRKYVHDFESIDQAGKYGCLMVCDFYREEHHLVQIWMSELKRQKLNTKNILYVHSHHEPDGRKTVQYGIGTIVYERLTMMCGSVLTHYKTGFDMDREGFLNAVKAQRGLHIKPSNGDYVLFYDTFCHINSDKPSFKTLVVEDCENGKLKLGHQHFWIDDVDDYIFVIHKNPL